MLKIEKIIPQGEGDGLLLMQWCSLLVRPLKFYFQIPRTAFAFRQQGVLAGNRSQHYNFVNLNCYFPERALFLF